LITTFTLHPHQRSGSSVTFRWDVSPPSPLYRATSFTLRFPPTVDLGAIPDSLWPRIAFMCLHSHWVLLRPCRVELPFTLDAGEIEFWLRLMDTSVQTLEAYRGTEECARSVEFACHGPALAGFTQMPDSPRCATAFSGGKDSLLQTGLLTELTARPLLVTTTSPLPPLVDHLTARRRHVLESITVRRDVTLVEVESDFRASADNCFPLNVRGYPASLNEMTDTFLYFSSLVAVSVAAGVTHLFLAGEAEVSENIERSGRTVQHTHFMYSTVTQRALAALLGPLGVRYGSLTAPLYSGQVQALLWTRYRDLRDLQYSCWNVPVGSAACSACRQCLRIALGALALGDRPARMGIELAPLLCRQRDWKPPAMNLDDPRALPTDLVRARISYQMADNLRATSLAHVAKVIALDSPGEFLRARGWRALAGFRQLRRTALGHPADWHPGYRAGALAGLDPLLRDSVAAIYSQYFPAEPEAAYTPMLRRSDTLAAWIAQPLEARRACPVPLS
jgi:hypothetical protein